MNKIKLNIFIPTIAVIVLLSTSCDTENHLATLNTKGDEAFKAGDNAVALQTYEQSIASYERINKQKECPVYTKAGLSALILHKNNLALNYLEKARFTASENEDTYLGLDTCYRTIDNLSKEMETLQTYKEKYPEGKNITAVNKRLFAIYTESENYIKALKLWPAIKPYAISNPKLTKDYFIVNKSLKHTKICDSLANAMLHADKHNIMALQWNGKKYYNRAENLYQKEVNAYNKHKTRRQYSHLLKAFDKVTADFKTSLFYFNTLYKIHPKSEYARYLANIYNRLNDKKKADYYKRKIN